MSGWISIHRKIKDNWIWEDKPFSKGQAWIDILLMVNHEYKKIPLGNELVEVKRGSRVTSIRQLCDRWGWSNTKVRGFLKLLEEEKMLIVKSDSKKTTLTVVNYNDYQVAKDSENDTETTEKHHGNITEKSQKHTNNNDNNENNENNDNKKDKNISLQIKNLRDRFSDSQLKVVDDFFDILKHTRKSAKLAESVVLKIYQSWVTHPIDKVLYGLQKYIETPSLHDKNEKYVLGIIRNAKASEVSEYAKNQYEGDRGTDKKDSITKGQTGWINRRKV